MKRKGMTIIWLLAGIVASCNRHNKETVTDHDWVEDTTQVIDVGQVNTVLPQAGNVALVESNCVPCHSLRYIEMQPPLSLHTWEKIVDKMITVYGAPVRDSTTRQDIINYLYAIRGLKQ